MSKISPEQAYRNIMVSLVGEEMARINLGSLPQRIEAWAEMVANFDSPEDIYWPDEPPPGAVGRRRSPISQTKQS